MSAGGPWWKSRFSQWRFISASISSAARAARRSALTRDVVVDARDEPAYVDFLFDQGLAIARRTGVATVALHARASSLRALERFVERARRADVELVDLRALAS